MGASHRMEPWQSPNDKPVTGLRFLSDPASVVVLPRGEFSVSAP
jgi:hypothetical protein